MSNKSKKALHNCECEICKQHPYCKVAKEHQAINRVLMGLDEKNKRRFVGVLASQRGNILQLSQITGLSRNTIYRGQSEVEHPRQNSGLGIRHSGAGRLPVEKKQPGILKALEKILQDATAGDPITGLKWTRKTSRKLASELRQKDFKVAHNTVSRLASHLGYSLRGNRKRLSRKQDTGRDSQMRYLIGLRNRFLRRKWPVISVDCKKKELIGLFRNAGRTLRREPMDVLATDFPSDASGKAIPYGIYDVQHNEGYMVVGVSHETAEFVIAAIRRWWLEIGRIRYKGCTQLLIQTDSGGANACDSWLWKVGLQTLADEFQLTITLVSATAVTNP